ncbi:FHA domain-containing protein [Herpetosiphon sp. NSE202]|uniref:FHA domain-containing protein n=1 Tax=Herpetosiphon sp. NSE202 TaxID=3351349 RepID=UPI003644438D
MKCPSCGHTNDGSNRFCEYCGARLDPAMSQEATQVGAVPNLHNDQSYDAPTMFVPADQAPPAPPAQAEPAASSLNCRECGYINQPGDRYCDQCGASLEAPAVAVGVDVAPVATPAPSASEAVTPPDGVPAVQAAEPSLAELTNVAPDEELPTVPIEEQQPFSAPSNESEPVVAATEEPVAAPVAEAAPVVAEEPFESPVAEAAPVLIAPEEPMYEDEPAVAASEQPAVETAPAVDAEAVSAERTALEAAIIEQEDNLVMFEQMSARYAGRALPAHIAAGIEETKTSLAEAQAALVAFDQAQAAAKAAAEAAAEAAQAAALPDPAEVERLETAIAEHQDNLAMFEQMSARYAGRALPTHIAAGLEESKHALAEAEAELAALRGGAPVAPAAPVAPPIPSAPVNTYDAPTVAAAAPSEPAPAPVAPAEPVAVPAPAVEATPAWAAPTPATPEPAPAWSAPTPVAPAAPVTPHLVVAGSQVVLNLPTDKQVYVIGREDPISGIYPEVDLTNHGGEGGGVSRQHARLHNTGGNWTLEDLNSTNYSKVNGQKLAPHAPAPVNHGDQLQFGKVVVTLHLH